MTQSSISYDNDKQKNLLPYKNKTEDFNSNIVI